RSAPRTRASGNQHKRAAWITSRTVPRIPLSRHQAEFRGHDEIILVQALELVSPQVDGELPSLFADGHSKRRVMALGVRQLHDACLETDQAIDGIEEETPRETLHAFDFLDLPSGRLSPEMFDLLLGHRR